MVQLPPANADREYYIRLFTKTVKTNIPAHFYKKHLHRIPNEVVPLLESKYLSTQDLSSEIVDLFISLYTIDGRKEKIISLLDKIDDDKILLYHLRNKLKIDKRSFMQLVAKRLQHLNAHYIGRHVQQFQREYSALVKAEIGRKEGAKFLQELYQTIEYATMNKLTYILALLSLLSWHCNIRWLNR